MQVDLFVFGVVQEKVVAHPASDVTPLDARHGVHGLVECGQSPVVCVQIRADYGVYARWTLTFFAGFQVFTFHAVHVGRRASQVGQISLETGHFGDLLHFFQYAFLAAAHDELSLMGRNGAKRASSEASPVQIHGKLYHFVSWYPLALVFRVG